MADNIIISGESPVQIGEQLAQTAQDWLWTTARFWEVLFYDPKP